MGLKTQYADSKKDPAHVTKYNAILSFSPSFPALQLRQQLHFPFHPTVQGYHWEGGEKKGFSEREVTYFAVSVVGGSFIKFFAQFKTDFCVFESALSPDHDFVPLAADDHRGLSHVPHLPHRKPHSYTAREKQKSSPAFFFFYIHPFVHTHRRRQFFPRSTASGRRSAMLLPVSLPSPHTRPSTWVRRWITPRGARATPRGRGRPGDAPAQRLSLFVCRVAAAAQLLSHALPWPGAACSRLRAAIPTLSFPHSYPGTPGKEQGALVLPDSSSVGLRFILYFTVMHILGSGSPGSTYPAPSCTRQNCGCPPASTSRRMPQPWQRLPECRETPQAPHRPAFKARARRGAGGRGAAGEPPTGPDGAGAGVCPPRLEGSPRPAANRAARGLVGPTVMGRPQGGIIIPAAGIFFIYFFSIWMESFLSSTYSLKSTRSTGACPFCVLQEVAQLSRTRFLGDFPERIPQPWF